MKINNNNNKNNINKNMKDKSKNNNIDCAQKEVSSKYWIKSNKGLPQLKHLIALEEDMVDLVQKLNFSK